MFETFGQFPLYGQNIVELIALLVGWWTYSMVWDALVSVGISFLPFLFMMINALKENYESDNLNDDSDQQIRRVQTQWITMAFVMILCVIPSISISSTNLKVPARSCEIERGLNIHNSSGKKVLGEIKNQNINNMLTMQNNIKETIIIGNQSVRIPILWYVLHRTIGGVSMMVTSKIPCDAGLSSINEELNTSFIKDEVLANEVISFHNSCYVKARTFSLNQGTLLSAEADWLGAELYLENYYDLITPTEKPRKGIGLSDDKDSPYPITVEGYGYPSCWEWWVSDRVVQKEAYGLKEKLIRYYGIDEPNMLESLSRLFSSDSEDDILRNILKKQIDASNPSGVDFLQRAMNHVENGFAMQHAHNEESGLISGGSAFIAKIGVLADVIPRSIGSSGIQLAIPLAHAFVQMALIMVLPVVMVFGGYSLNSVLVIALSWSSIILWMPYFKVIKWLDDHFTTLVGIDWYTSPVMVSMINLILSALYLGVPLIFTTLLSVVGARVASMDMHGASAIGSAANTMGSKATSAAKNGIKGGAKKAMGKPPTK